MRYGFIGLGHLGANLAGSLLKAGFDLTVNDVGSQQGRCPAGSRRRLGGDAVRPCCKRRCGYHLPALAVHFRKSARRAKRHP